MKARIAKPTSREDRNFIADSVVRFYKENPEEARTNSFAEIREAVHDLVTEDNPHRYFLIKTQSSLAGLIHTLQTDEVTVEIILIYLLPDYRRHGLGESALRQVLQKLTSRDIQRINTEVYLTNALLKASLKSLDLQNTA